jgi:alanine dehydrogenase
MKIGVPTEVKADEERVGLTPSSVHELVLAGQDVLVQSGAGAGIGVSDAGYEQAGGRIVPDAATVFAEAEMVVKVKEPQTAERQMLSDGQILFTYLHLAPDPEQASELLATGAVCIAYETVTAPDGSLPLLAPMSKVAGRMSVQVAAHHLESPQGGAGLLLGGVPGVPPAKVVVIGGGVVGENAAEVALGMGADVTVLDRNSAVLDRLAKRFGAALRTQYSTVAETRVAVADADVVISAVLVRGATAPKVVTADMVSSMRAGSVIVDVAIDQGGAVATSRPTTHHQPTFSVDGVIHYCVTNMPGAVPKTATSALNNETLPFVLTIAIDGLAAAVERDPHLRNGVNVAHGHITNATVAEALGLPFASPLKAI